MKEVHSLEGPVLKVNGELVLFIPLSAGGDELLECSRGISEVQIDVGLGIVVAIMKMHGCPGIFSLQSRL